MNKNCAVIFFLLVSTLHVTGLAAQDTLYWSKADTLSWNDFQATPDYSSGFYAASSAGISYTCEYTDSGVVCRVSAFFVRPRSWRKFGNSTEVLKHEQGHFDITEIYARKLAGRLALLKTDKKNFRKEAEAIGAQTIRDKNLCQAKYDRETASGTRKNAQNKWAIAIRQQLNNEPGCCEMFFYP